MGRTNRSDPIGLRLPRNVLAAVEEIAEACGRRRSWVMVQALEAYLAGEGADILAVRNARKQVARGAVHAMERVLRELDDVVHGKIA